ncbi:MAG: phytanoyl-CoA dioxygenase family protein [Candidatus Hydrogenedentes bacterium]|nr:phytanoyl-CoA dioxygenase family protein [Candidatus Hydrogenedentota bacterium]
MSLAYNQIEQFKLDGYVYVGPIVTSDELVALRTAYDRIFAAKERPASFRELGLKEGETTAKLSVMQVIDMWRLDDTFRAVFSKSEVLDMVEILMGTTNIRLYHDQALYKPAFHGDEVPWHQDNSYWKFDPANAVSCWMALDDVDEENGCMRIIPGSHRNGGIGHQTAGRSLALLATEVDESQAVPLPMPAGCAMFHHCLTLHNTKPNRTPRQRRAWAIHYIPADAKQNGKPLPERLLVRGEALVT